VTGPLTGIRVLDASRILAGPFCTMLLGDLGAEIIKVEMPGIGDGSRAWGPPFIKGESAYYLSINRNKKSITINLKHPKGREIIYKLVEMSDVFIENFRPSVAEKLGVSYDKLKRVNPKIIYCSISGFGQTGPYKDKRAYDLLIQAMSGFMGITGEPNRPPVRIGVAIMDLGAGMYAAISILAALIAREKTGKGQKIDISLLDTGVSWLTYMAMNYFATGRNPPKMGSAHPNLVPYQCFEDKNGRYFAVAVGNDEHWKRLCKALELQDWIDNPKYATNAKRVEHRDEIVKALSELFKSKTREEWLKLLEEEGVPCAPVYEVSEALSNPQIIHREMVIEIEHPTIGKLKQLGTPMKLSETPCQIRYPPPLLGQHTKEILKELLGYSDEEIEELRKIGAI